MSSQIVPDEWNADVASRVWVAIWTLKLRAIYILGIEEETIKRNLGA